MNESKFPQPDTNARRAFVQELLLTATNQADPNAIVAACEKLCLGYEESLTKPFVNSLAEMEKLRNDYLRLRAERREFLMALEPVDLTEDWLNEPEGESLEEVLAKFEATNHGPILPLSRS